MRGFRIVMRRDSNNVLAEMSSRRGSVLITMALKRATSMISGLVTMESTHLRADIAS